MIPLLAMSDPMFGFTFIAIWTPVAFAVMWLCYR